MSSRGYLKHTNQCLSAASASITQYCEMEASSSMLMGKVAQQALRTSAVMQLMRSLDAYLKELASELLPNDPHTLVTKVHKQQQLANGFSSLIAAGADFNEVWAAIEPNMPTHANWGHFAALKNNPDSWFVALLSTYSQLWWPLESEPAGVEKTKTSSIQLVDVTAKAGRGTKLADVDGKCLKQWLFELKSLVDLHRQSLQEW